MRGRKLRSDVNWQGALKQKCVEQMGVKQSNINFAFTHTVYFYVFHTCLRINSDYFPVHLNNSVFCNGEGLSSL